MVRNYIDWMLALPWYEDTEDKLDIAEAEQILDEDHYGLKKPKERILEYLAVQELVDEDQGPHPLLRGPARRGQDLARQVHRPRHRPQVRAPVAWAACATRPRSAATAAPTSARCPGKIIQSLKKAGSDNPVFLLDEVDKMSTDFRGDPSAALLEVLDPEQNHTFNDHYLDLDYDLSKVMFITTANTMRGIPLPLQDRMEIIRLAGYTELEKLSIAKRYLIPKQQERTASATWPGHLEAERAPGHHPPLHRSRACATWSARSPPSAARSPRTSSRAASRGQDLRRQREAGPEVPGPAQVPLRHRRGGGPDRPGHRPGLDRARRRAAHRRGHRSCPARASSSSPASWAR